jgi:hypothetical protein
VGVPSPAPDTGEGAWGLFCLFAPNVLVFARAYSLKWGLCFLSVLAAVFYLSGLQNHIWLQKAPFFGCTAAGCRRAGVGSTSFRPAASRGLRPHAAWSDKERPEVPASDVAKCLGNMYGAG